MKTAKVIKILDNYSILINYGRTKGATVGENVQIVEIGPEIIDPDSGESLGTLDHIKDVLQIQEVFDEFSICNKRIQINFTAFVDPFKQTEKIYSEQELLVNKEQITKIQRPQSNTINLGDIAKII